MLKRLSCPALSAAATVTAALFPMLVHAGGVVTEGCPKPEDPPPPAASKPASSGLTATEQEVYLWAASVFNGHLAWAEAGVVADEDAAESAAPELGIGGDADDASAAGCSAATGAGWAGGVALAALLGRGRRRQR